MYIAVCALVFVACYTFTIVTTSVGYHRGLAHGAVRIREPFRSWLVAAGIWLTSIDPKGWVVMHRMHHAYSDTRDDPHAPKRKGVLGFLGMFRTQILSYNVVLDGLRANDPRFTSIGKDLEMSWPIRTERSWLPILLHVAIAVGVVAVGGGWLLALALFAGMMSHVVQGAVINYFGHAHGGRNFDSDDDSRNNHLAAWLVLGEGFQNNHHRWASSARFSYTRREVDLGWAACLALEKLGVLEVQRKTLMPRAARASAAAASARPPERASLTA